MLEQFALRITGFSFVVSCDEIALWKILLLTKSLAKAHMIGRHF
jgi:hypothetical protein